MSLILRYPFVDKNVNYMDSLSLIGVISHQPYT